ncbi:MAG: recombinase family protein [Anaeromicrobium sp.]|uniref:recombinase family protein n=1 Tax=Anaeromicrobium sp. TaxID=1929132 RepID=UPI0025FEA0F2|nr:recombinase family protein [Anaeromicrobium sp.]MCT4595066.1 recombinase family protein [Anaeromicrobium sp.]
MKLGYIRVSTLEQNEGRQRVLMEEKNIEKIFIDKCSGKDTNRPKLKEIMEYAREGDIIHIESFSRLARSTKDLLELVDYFKSKGVSLVSFKENLDTTTPTGKLMLTMIGAIAEFERECLLERQREGIALAKAEGKYKGRKKIDFPEEWEAIYNKYKIRDITATKAMELLDLKRNTFYRLKEDWE